jgi:hypothetical protein
MSTVTEAGTNEPQRHTSSKMLRGLASFISYVFHPVFMPSAMAFILFMLARDTHFAGVADKTFYMWLAMLVLNTVFFPLITILLLKGLGFIKSIKLEDPKDRIIPLIGCMIFYFWANNVVSNTPEIPQIMHTLTLGSFWGIIAVFMVSIFFKVSMHTAGAGGMLGILLVLMFTSPVNMVLPFFVALIIAGIIGTARMMLGAHRAGEIWLGYFLGIAVQVAASYYLAKI